MDAPTSGQNTERGEDRASGCYIYGVVPADVRVRQGTPGVGDPPGMVSLIAYDDIAALVSEVNLRSPLGTPEDLTAHERVLDWTASQTPVLPMRFGAVMTSKEEVASELLAKNHDDFAAALSELEGRAEYVVKGRYIEETTLAEILRQNPQASRLRDEIRGKDEAVTRNQRIRLGEMINSALEAKRQADTETLADEIEACCEATRILEPTHEMDAVHLAVLASRSRQAELERTLQELARDWDGRVDLRLLGPLAPYDFVTSATPAD